MTNLNDAEICLVPLDAAGREESAGCWLTLSDYKSLSEVYTACEIYFGGRHTDYVFGAWSGIPDTLIRREWICPDIFEIQDALRNFDDDEVEAFVRWCGRYGCDMAVDDVPTLVGWFREMTGCSCLATSDDDEFCDEVLECQAQDRLWLDMRRSGLELFDDNYD